jgi:cytochrome c oxidase subunit III
VTHRHTHTQQEFAQRLLLGCLAVFGVAGGAAYLLIRSGGHPALERTPIMPAAFWLSTALLAGGSVSLHRALMFVRIERQSPFRRSLLAAMTAGIAFVAVQSYGLWHLLQKQAPAEVAVGADAFIFVLAVLHGLHFSVALMFLVFVTLWAWADRYDHEYYWGVTVCTYFWHFLGAVWMCIVGVIVIT